MPYHNPHHHGGTLSCVKLQLDWMSLLLGTQRVLQVELPCSIPLLDMLVS